MLGLPLADAEADGEAEAGWSPWGVVDDGSTVTSGREELGVDVGSTTGVGGTRVAGALAGQAATTATNTRATTTTPRSAPRTTLFRLAMS